MKKLVIALACALALATVSLPAFASPARTAPKLANPAKRGAALVHRFFVLIQNKDVPALRRFLTPAFQVERADGSGAGKKEYLGKLATIQKFQLDDVHATQAGGSLVVRYRATVTGFLNGRPYTPGPAPRLSAFSWNGKRWQLIAHANFNPLQG